MKILDTPAIRASALAMSVLTLTLASVAAQAGPLVTQWGYSTNVAFSGATWNVGTGNDPYGFGTTISTSNELSWGATGEDFQNPDPAPNEATNRSALTAGNVVTGALTGGGPATSAQLGRPVELGYDANVAGNEIGRGTSFTHWNNPIWNTYNSLAGAIITDTITLYPNVAGNGSYTSPPEISGPTLTFNFRFLETTNDPANNGPCADGLNQDANYPAGCPDLFGFQDTQVLNNSFDYDGNTYYLQFLTLKPDLTIDTIGIQHLTNGECSVLGLNNGCFGFRTREGQETTQRFGFAITAAPIQVPEPGSVALLALGLVSLGVALRPRRLA